MSALIEFVANVIMARWIFSSVRKRQARRIAERIVQTGVATSGVRVVEGSVQGMWSGWIHGDWKITPGTLTLYGITITGLVPAAPPRNPALAEAWDLAGDAVVVRLRCERAVLEWALMPGSVQPALDRLSAGAVPPSE